MTQTPLVVATHEVDGLLEAWRLRVLRLLVGFASAVLWAPLALVVAGCGVDLPPALRVVCVVLYGALLVLWRRPAWSLSWQVIIFLALIALAGAIRLAVGHPRLCALLPGDAIYHLADHYGGWLGTYGLAYIARAFAREMSILSITSILSTSSIISIISIPSINSKNGEVLMG